MAEHEPIRLTTLRRLDEPGCTRWSGETTDGMHFGVMYLNGHLRAAMGVTPADASWQYFLNVQVGPDGDDAMAEDVMRAYLSGLVEFPPEPR